MAGATAFRQVASDVISGVGSAARKGVSAASSAARAGARRAEPYVRSGVNKAAETVVDVAKTLKPGSGLNRDVSENPLFQTTLKRVRGFNTLAELGAGDLRSAEAIAQARTALGDPNVMKTVLTSAESNTEKVAKRAARRMRGRNVDQLSDRDIEKVLDFMGADKRVQSSATKFGGLRALTKDGDITPTTSYRGVDDAELDRMSRFLSRDPDMASASRKMFSARSLEDIDTRYLMDRSDRASAAITTPVKGYFKGLDATAENRTRTVATRAIAAGSAGLIGGAAINNALTEDDY